jgi:hypothetical protein
VKFGRKPTLNPFQREQALARLSTGVTQAEVARTYGVDLATISRLASPLPFGAGASLRGAGSCCLPQLPHLGASDMPHRR